MRFLYRQGICLPAGCWDSGLQKRPSLGQRQRRGAVLATCLSRCVCSCLRAVLGGDPGPQEADPLLTQTAPATLCLSPRGVTAGDTGREGRERGSGWRHLCPPEEFTRLGRRNLNKTVPGTQRMFTTQNSVHREGTESHFQRKTNKTPNQVTRRLAAFLSEGSFLFSVSQLWAHGAGSRTVSSGARRVLPTFCLVCVSLGANLLFSRGRRFPAVLTRPSGPPCWPGGRKHLQAGLRGRSPCGKRLLHSGVLCAPGSPSGTRNGLKGGATGPLSQACLARTVTLGRKATHSARACGPLRRTGQPRPRSLLNLRPLYIEVTSSFRRPCPCARA